VVACGVVYAAARRFGVPLPENPPWWKVFDADKSSIDEVCRVLALLYSRPKAKYIPVCKEVVSFSSSSKAWDSQTQPVPKEGSLSTPVVNADNSATKTGSVAAVTESGGSKDAPGKQGVDKSEGSKKSDDVSKDALVHGEGREEFRSKSKPELRTDTSVERSKDRDREREKNRDRDRDREKYREGDLREKLNSWSRDRGRDSDREREPEEADRGRDKVKEKGHRSRDRAKDSGGHSDKSKHHSSRDRERDRDRDYYYSSRDKDRQRHH